MSKKELKEKLHQQIDAIDDEMALQMLHDAAIEYKLSGQKDTLDRLTAGQLERLNESLQQLNNGKWKSNEEVMKLSRQWLTK